MTPLQYKAALKRLGLSVIDAASYFGVGRRQAQRIASGDSPVPKLVEKVVRLLLTGKLTKQDLL